MGSQALTLAEYQGSRDYKRLARLARQTSVICIVEYKASNTSSPIRDVAQTQFIPHRGDGFYQICARDRGYVIASDEDEFVQLCEQARIEFLEPNRHCQ